MKITLEIVRQILKDALGFDSFTAGFISSVCENDSISTAAITKDGHLEYNPRFVAKHIANKQDLFCLLFHEAAHPLFGHFVRASGEIENIAADAIINATISTIYSEESNRGSLFRKLYSARGVECLLRPQAKVRHSRFDRTYERLYGCSATESALTTGELITTLKVLLPSSDIEIPILLGSHHVDPGDPYQYSRQTLGQMAEDIKRSVGDRVSVQAGYNANLVEMLYEALRSHLSIKRQILQRFTTTRKVDRFKETLINRRVAISPVPIYPSKRDLVVLGSGFYPGFFHNRLSERGFCHKGLPIYLDVSGSVDSYLPKIIGILRSLKNEISTVYLFSNKVFEVRFSDLLKGKVRTTGGTDFDCIAKSIEENDLDKAVVITDGYASMTPENTKMLKRRGVVMLTILFDRAQKCPALEEFGEIVLLKDICQ